MKAMDRRRVRTETDWQTMTSELQALKRKLHSKSEALLIISKDLDVARREKDQFKLMAEKLRVRCQAYKRQLSDFPVTKDQASLIQMLRDMKNQKMAHQKQSEVLQQKLNEALGDVKLLRERFARQRIGDEGVGPRHFPAHEREKLVEQLEDAKQQAENSRQELVIAADHVTELMTEKSELVRKAERLNVELNFMLNGDKKRIIDIDALCMENKYLQERVQQCQEEKNSLHSQISKFKALLNSRKASNTDLKPGKIRNSGLVISPRQVQKILMDRAGLPSSAETVSDLQSIAAALLETINDKNLALHHLRNTNKILGKRVAELELKLKTLEVAGLWTMAGQSRQPVSSTPPTVVVGSGRDEEEFLSSLGSRLSKLTDACDRSFKEKKLISLTPESSGSACDVTGFTDDVIGDETPSDAAETQSNASGNNWNATEDVVENEAYSNNTDGRSKCSGGSSVIKADDAARYEVACDVTWTETQSDASGNNWNATEDVVENEAYSKSSGGSDVIKADDATRHEACSNGIEAQFDDSYEDTAEVKATKDEAQGRSDTSGGSDVIKTDNAAKYEACSNGIAAQFDVGGEVTSHVEVTKDEAHLATNTIQLDAANWNIDSPYLDLTKNTTAEESNHRHTDGDVATELEVDVACSNENNFGDVSISNVSGKDGTGEDIEFAIENGGDTA